MEQKILCKARTLTLREDMVRLQNGATASREIVEHCSGVAVLALLPDDQVLFVRQFRIATGGLLLELPAGKLEPGEDPEACGRRELEEETGYQAGRTVDMGHFYVSPGYITEMIHLYAALDLIPTAQHLDQDEFLQVETMPLQEALTWCRDGRLRDAKTVLALLQFQGMRAQGLINA